MIIQADILDWAKTYTGPKFHALLCDPPYHLTSIVERFGKVGSAEAQGDVYARAAKGFMGKDWDGGDIAFQPATWAAITQHLYPGAWGMAFAGSRGWHRMAVAIEDAGLIMQPTIFGWGYGNGFPKVTRIDTQIDAAAFRAWLKLHPAEQARLQAARLAERAARKARDRNATKETKAALQALTLAYKAAAGLLPATIGTKKHQPKFAAAELGYREKDNGYNSRERETFDVLDCATDAARYWLGHRYGGQAMKPALEPIIVFQKPYDGSPLACITSTGAGALWIDGARIGGGGDRTSGGGVGLARDPDLYESGLHIRPDRPEGGRWPANLVLSHSPACNGHCAPDCPVAALGAQSGELASGGQVRGTEESVSTNGIYGEYGDRSTVRMAAPALPRASFFRLITWPSGWSWPTRSPTSPRPAGLSARPGLTRARPRSCGCSTMGMRGMISSPPTTALARSSTAISERANATSWANCVRSIRPGCDQRRPRHANRQPVSARQDRAAQHAPDDQADQLTRYLATLLLPPASMARGDCSFRSVVQAAK
jgi:hypothetical protein